MVRASETRRSAPFRTRDDALTVRLHPEAPVHVNGSTIDASELMPAQQLQITLEVTVDWEMLREGTGCTAPMDVVLVSRCKATRWSEVGSIGSAVENQLLQTWRHILTLDRQHVSGPVDCEVAVILAQDAPEADTIAAQRMGSVLARSGFTIRFERGGLEFPTRWISFSEHHYPPEALWTLTLSEDSWFLPATEAIQLQLNRDKEAFHRLLMAPNREQRQAAAVLQQQIVYDCLCSVYTAWLTGDVRRQPVDRTDNRFTDVVYRSLTRMLGEDVDSLATLAAENPTGFRMRIQAGLRLGRSIP